MNKRTQEIEDRSWLSVIGNRRAYLRQGGDCLNYDLFAEELVISGIRVWYAYYGVTRIQFELAYGFGLPDAKLITIGGDPSLRSE